MEWPVRRRGRSRRELLGSAWVLTGLTAFVLLTYLLIVVGGGALAGHTSSPLLGLSVLATAVVAVAFDPVQRYLEEQATRVFRRGQPSPYEVLRRFSADVTGTHPAEELPVRMAQVLAEGTGAEWSQVWVVVGGRTRLAATWPPGATREPADGEEQSPGGDGSGRERMLPVRQAGELLGMLVVQERPSVRLTPVEERLFAGLASQAGLVLRGARLRAELEQRRSDLSARADELRVSRQRLVDAQDDERRRLERDIHDGAQQHLVALAVNLRLAQTLATRAPERAGALLAAQEQAAADAHDTLVQLSRGIYPPMLADRGLPAALDAAFVNLAVPVRVTAEGVGRFPPTLEAAAYFCALEAVQNAAKHSGARAVRITLRDHIGALEVEVEDDGSGFELAVANGGTGLSSMRDRVESVGGTLELYTSSTGTRVRASLPVRAVPAVLTVGS